MRTTGPSDARAGSGSRSGQRPRLQDERGAILVHVAVAFVALLGFSVLTIDLGVVWVARTQAQAAADAGSLAGAVSLAYAAPGDNGIAEAAASAVAMANPVWGLTPNVGAGSDAQVTACPPGVPTPGACLSVNVQATAGNGAALPVYFAPILGLTAPDVYAVAWAQATNANETTCLKPWALPDRWDDASGQWPDDIFAPPDLYARPGPGGPGTGYTVGGQFGQQIRMDVSPIVGTITGQNYLSLDLGLGGEGAYATNITGCYGSTFPIGGQLTYAEFHPQTAADAAQVVINRDLGATWSGQGVQGSAFAVSPRVVAIALYDPDAYMLAGAPLAGTLEITNIVGFFIEEVDGRTIVGRIVPVAGTWSETAPQLTDASSFLRAITLVR